LGFRTGSRGVELTGSIGYVLHLVKVSAISCKLALAAAFFSLMLRRRLPRQQFRSLTVTAFLVFGVIAAGTKREGDMLPWNELLANLALVALTTSIWTAGHRSLGTASVRNQNLAFGLLMAVATLLVMLIQFEFTPGVLLDLRYTLLAVAGYFGGPVAVIFPLAIAVVKRLYSGGTGIWVAIPHIVLAVSSGLYGYYFLPRKESLRSLALLSAAVVFSGTVGFFLMIPMDRWPVMISNVVAPFAMLLFVSTFFSAFALADELKRKRLMQENQIYRAVFHALPDCLNAKDLQGRFMAANVATANLMGAGSADDLIGKSDFEFYPESVARSFQYDEKRQRFSNEPLQVEQRFIRADGREAWLSTLKAPLRDAAGNIVGVITHNREITEQKHLELRLSETRRHLTDAMASMADGLAMFDPNDVLIFCNSRYQSLFPLTADVRLPGRSLREIVQASLQRGEIKVDAGSSPQSLEDVVLQLKTTGEVRQIHLLDGRWIEVRSHSTKSGGFLVVFADVSPNKQTEQRLQDLNQQLEALANTDQLTSLPNRRAFDLHLDATLFEASFGEAEVALLMIDVDHFKSYNDTYGHIAGDEALQRVATCVEKVLGDFPGASVSRYGGEEFAAIMPYMSMKEAGQIGALVCAAVRGMSLPHRGSPKALVTISVGAAALRAGGMLSKSDLIEQADRALYQAKADGRDCVRYPDVSIPDCEQIV
jgi:diguanylate cyclase (GGDEF)-like protein/PAS domain S-box-containing protein